VWLSKRNGEGDLRMRTAVPLRHRLQVRQLLWRVELTAIEDRCETGGASLARRWC